MNLYFRDWDRVVQWAILSNNMDFLTLPASKLKNKVICDLHFKEDCFMNYKKERLVKKAVPTIYIKNGEEIDLMLNPGPYVIENNQKPVLSNPAESFKFSVSNAIDLVENKDDLYQMLDEVEAPAKKMKTNTNRAIHITTQVKSKPTVATTKFTVLNKNVGQKYINSVRASQSPVLSLSKPKTINSVLNKEIVQSVQRKFNVIKNEVSKPLNEEPPQPEFMVITMPMEETEDAEEMEEVEEIEEIEEINEMSIVEEVPIPTQSNHEVAVDLMPILMDSLKQIGEIKSILNVRHQDQMVSSLTKDDGENSITQSQLNKVQLFNGIKRYLSPAMQALLRIELFSNAEREYKPDEKVLSSEILKLGSPVYDFLCEEWRLRLPPKKDVQLWINDQPNTDEDDAC